ncbi:MAG TPA: helix-turn-helix transcriptional regulator [Hyphomicrobiaceae bacterium]|jgi:excisionase family DNA binding protein|nr:helix-turn-helix transcriptional regulator [Hyphomicrobiaceae bacterium]
MNMQAHAGLVLLTTTEAAEYLRIKERKLYELVAEGAIPCTKVTGKWLFPRGDLDRWLLAGMARPHGVVPADPPPIIGGSHDPLLQWALAECRAGIAILPEGSKTGFRRFLKGELLAAAVHFHSREAPEADANVETVAREPGLYDAVLIGFAKRKQGMVVAPGNPLGLRSLADAAEKKAGLAARPPGAGAQQLLGMLMARAGLESEAIPTVLTAPTGADIAQAIRAGHADFGIATTAIATAAGLDFVPLVDERFDLVMRQRDSYRSPLAKFLELVRSASFAAHAKELGGFDVTDAGKVRWAP